MNSLKYLWSAFFSFPKVSITVTCTLYKMQCEVVWLRWLEIRLLAYYLKLRGAHEARGDNYVEPIALSAGKRRRKTWNENSGKGVGEERHCGRPSYQLKWHPILLLCMLVNSDFTLSSVSGLCSPSSTFPRCMHRLRLRLSSSACRHVRVLQTLSKRWRQTRSRVVKQKQKRKPSLKLRLIRYNWSTDVLYYNLLINADRKCAHLLSQR